MLLRLRDRLKRCFRLASRDHAHAASGVLDGAKVFKAAFVTPYVERIEAIRPSHKAGVRAIREEQRRAVNAALAGR